MLIVISISIICLFLTGCSATDTTGPFTLTYDFNSDNQGWEGGFSDLPVNHKEHGYDLVFEYMDIPVEGEEGGGLFLKGNNHSDDLFLYTTKDFGSQDGLKPNTKYDIQLSFELATNVPSGMMGIGGSPGESVYIKAGVVNGKPESNEEVVGGEPYFRMNIDIGSQSNSGNDMVVLGNAAKGEGLGQGDESYQYKNFNHDFRINTNDEGKLWVIIGADSGFEGISELYFDNISITFTKILDTE